VEWILSIPADKRLHFVAGLVIATFFCIALGMKACIVPAIAAAFIKEFFDLWTSKDGEGWDWWDFVATILGGLVPQAFVLLHMWWF
jgi:hypothetical protein